MSTPAVPDARYTLSADTIGLVEAHTMRFNQPMSLECGTTLLEYDIAYGTCGELNTACLDKGRTVVNYTHSRCTLLMKNFPNLFGEIAIYRFCFNGT